MSPATKDVKPGGPVLAANAALRSEMPPPAKAFIAVITAAAVPALFPW
eukprot:CAMPEP_0117505632 /NCGR_PEP_ID=MMETSP0784-20121206/25484_1 /TAXON_ID=39447 /ORGANISM="" /LENGTH=47 /DNA_ID= /DNA_START= /DNA_END= /DNA_ORIENTATION=